MHRAAQAYFQTGVTTTGQGDILLMLYDGAIKFMNQAKERLEANDMAGKGNNITKALQILEELNSILDMQKGGELSANLRNLYIFCTNRLVMANIKKSTEIIDEVIKIVTGLRAAFAAIVDLPEAQEAAAQVAATQRANGILPVRSQPGTTAPAASAPGAAVRLRNFYAQNQQEAPPASMDNEAMTEQREELQAPQDEKQMATGTEHAAAASGVEAAAPVQLAEEALQPVQVPQPAEIPVAVSDTDADAPATGFPPPPAGFGGGRMTGSSLYKKMAQQQ